MNKKDLIYQKAVDKEANKLLKLTPQQFREFEDYGTLDTNIENIQIRIGWWHYKLDNDLYHIVYITGRKVFFFLHKKYINGAKLYEGKIHLLTNIEVGMYD